MLISSAPDNGMARGVRQTLFAHAEKYLVIRKTMMQFLFFYS